MGLFDSFRNNPKVDELVELKKQQTQAEAAKINEGIHAYRDAKIAETNAAHAARMAPVEAGIAKHKSDRETMLNNALLNSHCMSLMMRLYSPLTNAARANAADRVEASKKMRADIAKAAEVIQAEPTKKNLEAFQAWALDQVKDEQGKAAVQKEFQQFTERLDEDGITLR